LLRCIEPPRREGHRRRRDPGAARHGYGDRVPHADSPLPPRPAGRGGAARAQGKQGAARRHRRRTRQCDFLSGRGIHGRRLLALTETGYKLGRTTMAFHTAAVFEPARMPISVDFRRASRIALARHALRDANIAGLADWLRLARLEADPLRLGTLLFDAALARGGIFHVNARSWEIDGNHLWDDLAALLSYIANRPAVRYLTNSEVLAFISPGARPGRATDA